MRCSTDRSHPDSSSLVGYSSSCDAWRGGLTLSVQTNNIFLFTSSLFTNISSHKMLQHAYASWTYHLYLYTSIRSKVSLQGKEGIHALLYWPVTLRLVFCSRVDINTTRLLYNAGLTSSVQTNNIFLFMSSLCTNISSHECATFPISLT